MCHTTASPLATILAGQVHLSQLAVCVLYHLSPLAFASLEKVVVLGVLKLPLAFCAE